MTPRDDFRLDLAEQWLNECEPARDSSRLLNMHLLETHAKQALASVSSLFVFRDYKEQLQKEKARCGSLGAVCERHLVGVAEEVHTDALSFVESSMKILNHLKATGYLTAVGPMVASQMRPTKFSELWAAVEPRVSEHLKCADVFPESVSRILADFSARTVESDFTIHREEDGLSYKASPVERPDDVVTVVGRPVISSPLIAEQLILDSDSRVRFLELCGEGNGGPRGTVEIYPTLVAAHAEFLQDFEAEIVSLRRYGLATLEGDFIEWIVIAILAAAALALIICHAVGGTFGTCGTIAATILTGTGGFLYWAFSSGHGLYDPRTGTWRI